MECCGFEQMIDCGTTEEAVFWTVEGGEESRIFLSDEAAQHRDAKSRSLLLSNNIHNTECPRNYRLLSTCGIAFFILGSAVESAVCRLELGSDNPCTSDA